MESLNPFQPRDLESYINFEGKPPPLYKVGDFVKHCANDIIYTCNVERIASYSEHHINEASEKTYYWTYDVTIIKIDNRKKNYSQFELGDTIGRLNESEILSQ